jgi:hypothetical protein
MDVVDSPAPADPTTVPKHAAARVVVAIRESEAGARSVGSAGSVGFTVSFVLLYFALLCFALHRFDLIWFNLYYFVCERNYTTILH